MRVCVDPTEHETTAENVREVSESVLGQAPTIKEEWRRLITHPNYEANNMGQVRKIGDVLPLPFWWDERGYRRVALWNGRKAKQATIHKMVAEVFLPPQPTSKHTVNHSDGIKDNNWAINLEWATHSEQQFHAHKLELRSSRGVHNSQSKLTENDIRAIRKLLGTMYHRAIGEKFGVSKSQISHIALRKQWAHVI